MTESDLSLDYSQTYQQLQGLNTEFELVRWTDVYVTDSLMVFDYRNGTGSIFTLEGISFQGIPQGIQVASGVSTVFLQKHQVRFE